MRVCPPASIFSEPRTRPIFTTFLFMLPMTVALAPSGDDANRYVLPFCMDDVILCTTATRKRRTFTLVTQQAAAGLKLTYYR